MPYIGNNLATQFQAFATQTITGDGSTSYTLDRAVANGKELLVYINNVKQEEGSGKSYEASGTTITFSEAVASGDSCYLVYMGSAQQTVTAPAGSIVSGQIANASLEMPNSLDMNGKELILDADGDTSITADTDDQIDIRVGGSDQIKIATGEVAFNDASGSIDFRVESDSSEHGIFLDASEPSVGFGVGTADTVTAKMAIGLTGTVVSGSTDGATIGKASHVRLIDDTNWSSTDASVFILGGGSGGSIGQISSAIGFSRESNVNWGTQLRFYTHPADTTDLDELDERMRITANGNFSFGSNTPSNIETTILMTMTGNGSHPDHYYEVGPHHTADTPSFYIINESGTGVYMTHGGNSFQSHSDERIKENITSLGTVLPDIKNIRCVKYNLKGNSDTKIGFIAQDWESKFSEIVDENNSRQVIESDGSLSMADENGKSTREFTDEKGKVVKSESTTKVKSMSYTETIPVLLKAIQELSDKVETLETEVAKLKG